MRSLLEDLKARGLTVQVIMDVGAHKTEWSGLAKSVYPDAVFLLIEPQSELEPYLRDFCATTSQSKFFLAGAAADNTEKVLTVWPDLAGSSFLPLPDSSLIDKGEQRKIPMVTVDEVIRKNGEVIPTLIKLDVQGYELEVLKGAASTFGKTEAYIIEVSFFSFSDVHGMPVISDVINFMLERDYVVYDFGGFLRRPSDGALGQCDICFVKKEGMFRKSADW